MAFSASPPCRGTQKTFDVTGFADNIKNKQIKEKKHMKSKKSALLLSFTSLLLCFAMLAGSTFAWFTDTATTGVNKIQAGNLDIKLQYKNSTTHGEFTEANKETPVFDNNAQWEPGHVEYVVLKVSNAGSLALKYKLGINIANEEGSTNVYNNEFKLSDYIRFAVLDGDQTGNSVDRDALVAAAMDSKLIKEGYSKEDHLLAGENNNEKVVTLVVWMPTTVDNKANHKKDAAAPSVELGINVVAKQLNYENDSFGPDYDKDATYPVTDNTGLKDAINNATDGSTVLIASGEYTLSDPAETSKIEIPAGATIAGAGADNTTLNVNNDKIAKDNVTLKDMTIKGSGSQGTGGTLNVNGNNTTIENIDYKGDGNIAIAVSTGGSNSGTTFRGTKITNAFRGIQFWSLSGDSVIDNCVLDVAGYTFNIDAAVAGSTLTITNSTLNGWTSYTSGIKLVTFENCKLGLNLYSYLRPYSETTLVNCEFTSDGYHLNAGGSDAYTITLTNCTKNGTPITADNVKALLLDTKDWNSNATLIVNGVTVSV